LNPSSQKNETNTMQSIMRKLVLAAGIIVGIGYILVNIGGAIMIGYSLSSLSIITSEILPISGAVLFLVAQIVIVVTGIFLILGGLQYFKVGDPPQGVMFFGTLLASFYLLCLGIGSELLLTQLNFNIILLIVAPITVMVGTAIYMIPSFRLRLIGSILGIVGGILLAFVMLDPPTLQLVLGGMDNMWNDVPFSGPFMSMSFLEGMAIVLGSVAALVHSIFAERKEDLLTHVIFAIAGLVYGIGLFVGSLVLSFSFLDLLWKAPWLGPFYDAPDWVFGTGVFWSASLLILVIGGVVLIVCACLGFAFAAQEFSQMWPMPYSQSKDR